MSFTSALTTDWIQGDMGHGAPPMQLVEGSTNTFKPFPRMGCSPRPQGPQDAHLQHLLGALSDRIWRMELPQPLRIDRPGEELVSSLVHESSLRACHSTEVPEHPEHGITCHGMTLAEVLLGSSEDLNQCMQDFVANGFRVVNRESVEWDAEGHPTRVHTNLIGIVEGDRLIGFWGAQRSLSPGRSLAPTPRGLPNGRTACLCLVDAKGRIMFESPEFERMLGGAAELRKGQRLRGRFHHEDRDRMGDAIQDHIGHAEGGAILGRLRLECADGRWSRRMASIQSVPEVPGPPLFAIAFHALPGRRRPARADATPVKTAQEALSNTQVCALNNILAVISGHAQIAGMSDEVAPTLKEHLSVIVDAAQRASTTIVRMLS